MPTFFVDSSALVKRYRVEAGSDRVNALLDDSDRLIVARLAHVEVASAIVRRARQTGLPNAHVVQVINTLEQELRESFEVVEVDAPIFDRAVALT